MDNLRYGLHSSSDCGAPKNYEKTTAATGLVFEQRCKKRIIIMFGGFIPLLVYILFLRRDPSYTESIVSRRSVRSVTAEHPKPGEYHYLLSCRYIHIFIGT